MRRRAYADNALRSATHGLKPLQRKFSKTYVYHDLDTTKRQIRLVRLLQSEDNNVLRLDLQHFDLDEGCPAYIALSYTWGPASPTHEVFIGGHVLTVRLNLYNFLYHAWKTGYLTPETWLWVDQICIDQRNGLERNHQVQQMSEIYQTAFEVCAWIGNMSEDDKLAMKILKLYAKLAYDVEQGGNGMDVLSSSELAILAMYIPGMALWYRVNGRKGVYLLPSLTSESPGSTGRLGIFERFMDIEYWTRLWIMQEIFLARQLVIMGSEGQLDWESVQWILGSIQYWDRERNTHMERVLKAKATSFCKPGSVLTLSEAIKAARYSRCQDPRDQIYGLMGIVSDEYKLAVDYSKSPFQVFLEVLLKIRVYGTRVQNVIMTLAKQMDLLFQLPLGFWPPRTHFPHYPKDESFLASLYTSRSQITREEVWYLLEGLGKGEWGVQSKGMEVLNSRVSDKRRSLVSARRWIRRSI